MPSPKHKHEKHPFTPAETDRLDRSKRDHLLRRKHVKHEKTRVPIFVDSELMKRVNAALIPFRDRYFRAQIRGFENLPAAPSIIVGNHDGGYVAADALCFGSFFYEKTDYQGKLHVMMHDVPFKISTNLRNFLLRIGFLPACHENAERVLQQGRHLLVYPGGAHEAFRPIWNRGKIDLANRTGFVHQALKHRVPVVPLVSAGGHDTLFVLFRGKWLADRVPLARRLRAGVLPLWIGLPWGISWGPVPNLPLPAKIDIEMLSPIDLYEELGHPVNINDPEVLKRGLEIVRVRMQEAADRLYE
ncbi:MAG: lysophospholipid acyltransferase family protein, partial [Bdellovibrionota bacterium]